MTKGWTGFDLPDESEEVILFYDFNEPGYYKSHTTEALNFISDYGLFCVQVGFSKNIDTVHLPLWQNNLLLKIII